MASSSCPIPQVEEALRPYIRSRQDVLQIRQTINNSLQEKVGGDVTITQLTASSCNPSSKELSGTVQSSGLHKKFLEALAAHRRAQTTYAAAKSDLEQLKKSAKDDRLNPKPRDNTSLKTYVSSIRQKKQQDRLDVVQRALTKLDDLESHPAKLDIKSTVKERLGLPPDAPQLGMDQDQMSSQIEELTSLLKKAVLQAKTDLDAAKHDGEVSQQRVEQLGNVPVAVRLFAFQSAREELIQWIESELVKVSDDESGDSPEDDHGEVGYSRQEVQLQVQDLYERYVLSRQGLVESVEAVSSEAPKEAPIVIANEATGQSPTRAGATPSQLTASQLLSFLPSLMQTSRDEAALLQQTAFLRKQLNIASSETKQTIQRLAGESHLAPPDASAVNAWDKATREHTDKTRSFVLDQVKTGKDSISHARETLATLQAKRSALEHLKGHT
jgi:hypothetical protein